MRYTFKRSLIPRLNQDAMHKHLQVLFGERYLSISCAGDEIFFDFKEAADGDEQQLMNEITAHNPDDLTPHQERLKQRAEAYYRMVNLDVDGIEAKLDGKPANQNEALKEILAALRDLKAMMYLGSE